MRDFDGEFLPGDGWTLEVRMTAGEHFWRLLFPTSGVELGQN